MRILLVLALGSVLVTGGCGDGSTTNATATARPLISPAATSPARTPATSPPSGQRIEVQGIVGAVNLSARVIEIKPLNGGTVTQIDVSASTPIRRAAGGSVQLKDVRTSDRIVASGTQGDRETTLIASEITVQDVVPGGQPGG